MLDLDEILKNYETMNIAELKNEVRSAKKKIVELDNQIKLVKRKLDSNFLFLFVEPPKTKPSILKQTDDIEILDSSPKFSIENKTSLHNKADANEKKNSLKDPAIIQKSLEEELNMSIDLMIQNHDDEVLNIKFGSPKQTSIAEYFPNQK